MKKSELLKIIREEVEVILTNEEAQEFFDLDPAALLDEILREEEDEEKKRWRLDGKSSRSRARRRLYSYD